MIKAMLENLTADAEKIRNTDPQNLSTMEAGDDFHQGDVRVRKLPGNFVKKNVSLLTKVALEMQLAPGVTQGSRHLLQHANGVKMFRLTNATPLDGPIVEISEPNGVTHPEHGDVIELPAGCYAFPGQRQFADELKRALD